MRMQRLKAMVWSGVGCVAMLGMGCSAGSTNSGLATVQVSVARYDAVTTTAVSTQDVTTAPPVSLDNVSSLKMTLDAVQIQASGSGEWQTVTPTDPSTGEPYDPPLELDLKTDLSKPINLGSVTIENGACEARLFVSNPKITFDNPIEFGQQTVDAGQHDVVIPSGNQTGLKADGNCDATDATNVTLGFDMGATVGTIVVTGNDTILLTPVIHVMQP